MRKTLLAIATVVTLLCAVSISYAEHGYIWNLPTRYSYTRLVSAGLYIEGNTATCTGKGRGIYGTTTTCITVSLQRRQSSDDPWHTVCSWEETASGTNTASVYETVTVSSGYSYRVCVRCQIEDSDGCVLETVYKYSSIWSL